MRESDPWDWPILLYIATVLLKRTERQFWRMTPRKLNALSKAHIKMNKSEESEGAVRGTSEDLGF